MRLMHCKLRQWHLGRWVVINADDDHLGWSGSRWVKLGGKIQVSNFDTRGEAETYARGFGFIVLEDAPPMQHVRPS